MSFNEVFIYTKKIIHKEKPIATLDNASMNLEANSKNKCLVSHKFTLKMHGSSPEGYDLYIECKNGQTYSMTLSRDRIEDLETFFRTIREYYDYAEID